jgi:hypothetical protein
MGRPCVKKRKSVGFHKSLALAAAFLLFSPFAPPARAADAIMDVLPDEASKSLFAIKSAKADVEFYLKGTYSMSLASEPTITLSDAFTSAQTWALGGSAFSFEQVPEFTLRLLIAKAWFLDLTFSDDTSSSLFAVGYKGRASDFVREARLGNTGLAFPSYDYIDLGESGPTSPGIELFLGDMDSSLTASAGQGGRGFSAQALLRYEQGETETLNYVGKNLYVEDEIDASDYLYGRFFVLPSYPVTGLTLYVRSSGGAVSFGGESYQAVDLSGQTVSLARGTIELTAALRERARVSYTDSAGVTHSGELLHDPGAVLDTDVLSRYAISSTVAALKDLKASVKSYGSAAVSGLSASIDTDSEFVEVYSPAASDARDQAAREPFYALDPSLYDRGANRSSAKAYTVMVRGTQEKSQYEINTKAIPGTISVKVNGVTETGFTYVNGSGILNFNEEPDSSDRVEISYLTYNSSSGAKTLVAGLAGRFTLSPEWSAFAAMSARLASPSESYSTVTTRSDAAYILSGGVEKKGERLNAKLSGALAVKRADANGQLRLDGMEDFSETIPVVSGLWKRSAVPEGLSADGRSPLYYRDYTKTDALGNITLYPISWASAPDPSDTSVKQGPYIVSDGVYTRAAVAEFSLSPSQGWAGMQVALTSSLIENIGKARKLVIPVRYIPSSGDAPNFSYHVGMIGYSPDQDVDATSDDYRLADSGRVTSGSFTPNADESWTLIALDVTDALAAQIDSASALSLVAQSPSAAAGTLLVGTVYCVGADYVNESPLISASAVESTASGDAPEDAFSTDFEVYHPSDTNGWLYVTNSSAAALSVYKTIRKVPLKDYKSLTFYAKADDDFVAAGGSLVLSLAQASGEVYRVTVPASSIASSWRKITANLDDLSATVVDSSGSTTPASVSLGVAAISGTAKISWTLSGAGSVSVDELCLASSRLSVGGKARYEVSYKYEAPLITLGGYPILSKISLSSSGEGLVATDGLEYGATLSGSASLFPLNLSASATVSDSGSWEALPASPALNLSHSIELPWSFGSLKTAFSQTGSSSFAQRDSLSLSLGPAVFGLSGTADYSDESLGQDWNANLSVASPLETIALTGLSSLTLAATNPLSGLAYGSAWLESFQYLGLNRVSGSDSRAYSVSFMGTGTGTDPNLANDFLLNAGASYASGSSPSETSSLSLEISPNVFLGSNKDWCLTPFYRRSLTHKVLSDSSDFSGDWGEWLSAVNSFPLLWAGLPFAELYDGKAWDCEAALLDDPVKSEINASAGLMLKRATYFAWWDALVPSAAAYSLTRETTRLGSTVSEKIIHNIKLSHTVIDAFSAAGSLRVLKWAQSDECYLDQELSLTEARRGTPFAYQYSGSVTDTLGLGGKNTLKLSNDARATLNDTAGDEWLGDDFKLTLSRSRPLNAALSALIDSWLGGVLEREEVGNSIYGSDLLREWIAGSPDATDVWTAAVAFALTDEYKVSLAVPLSAAFGVKLDNAFSLSASLGLTTTWTRSASGTNSLILAPRLGLDASLTF